MKKSELIELLQQFDDDLIVYVEGNDGSIKDVEFIGKANIIRDKNKNSDYLDNHEQTFSGNEKGKIGILIQ